MSCTLSLAVSPEKLSPLIITHVVGELESGKESCEAESGKESCEAESGKERESVHFYRGNSTTTPLIVTHVVDGPAIEKNKRTAKTQSKLVTLVKVVAEFLCELLGRSRLC